MITFDDFKTWLANSGKTACRVSSLQIDAAVDGVDVGSARHVVRMLKQLGWWCHNNGSDRVWIAPNETALSVGRVDPNNVPFVVVSAVKRCLDGITEIKAEELKAAVSAAIRAEVHAAILGRSASKLGYVLIKDAQRGNYWKLS